MKKVLLFLFLTQQLLAGDPIIKCINKKIDGVSSIKALGERPPFSNVYDIRLIQPVDHLDPSAGTFEQRIYLYHKSRKKPVIFVTEGYNLYDRQYELTDILDANQISVEYRFYGKSGSDNIQWSHLNNTQAAMDLHRIKDLFDDIYKKEWVSTGISKGGTTTMIYKALYPEDMDASVNYVGPLPLAQEDKRMDEHIRTIGSRPCRAKLSAFQKEALKRREALLPKLDSLAKEEDMSFQIGLGAAYEYAVLEYTFSFWQYAHDCDKVPDASSTDQEIFEHLNTIVGFDFYSDATYDFFANAFYQFMGENGYYGFIHDHLVDQLKYATEPTNLTFTPKGIPLRYSGAFMLDIENRLKEVGDKMIHIHGEYDPWGAVGFFPEKNQDALLIVHPKGGHTTRISTLTEDEKNQVYSKLDEWLNAKVTPLNKKS